MAGLSERSKARWPLRSVILALAATATAQDPPGVANDMFPRFSSDGRQIIFTSDRDGDPEIYVMDADGSNPKRLTHEPGRDAHPYFSRASFKVLFQSPRANGKDTNIWAMAADGSRILQLTDLEGFAGVPVYSKNEMWVAFQWRATSDFTDGEKWRICLMRGDGSGFRVITPGDANDQVPGFSADGQRLLFFSDRTGRNQLYTMSKDGSDVQPVARSEFDDSSGQWSPDGEQIVFASERDGSTDVYVMNADGSGPRRLTHDVAVERGPVWSPNGTKITFSSNADGPSAIYVMNADGSERTRVPPVPALPLGDRSGPPDRSPNVNPSSAGAVLDFRHALLPARAESGSFPFRHRRGSFRAERPRRSPAGRDEAAPSGASKPGG